MVQWRSGPTHSSAKRKNREFKSHPVFQIIHCRLGARDRMHPEETVRFRSIGYSRFDSYTVGLFLFRKIRARCMDLTVNQWLGEFDPHTRSQ